MPDVFLSSEPFLSQIRVRSLWPPGMALNREVLALLPASSLKKSDTALVGDEAAWSLLPSPGDLFLDGEGREPCYVLGPCVYDGAGYVPRSQYAVSEIVYWTKRFSAPQREANKRRMETERRARLREEAERDKADRWRRSEAERLDREAKANPLARLKEMEEKLARLQEENQQLIVLAQTGLDEERVNAASINVKGT